MTGGFERCYALGIAAALPLGMTSLAIAQSEPPALPAFPPLPATSPSEASSADAGSSNATPHAPEEPLEPDDIPAPAPPVHRSHECKDCNQGLTLDGWLGAGATRVISENGWSGSFGIGITGLYHYQWFELGAGGRALLEGLGNSALLTALVGGKTEPEPRLRLELLAEVGMEHVYNVGAGLFEKVIGGNSDATEPYLGGRASASLLLGDSRRFLLGWWLNAGETIGGTVVNPVVQSCLLGCSTTQGGYSIGGPSVSTGIRIGGDAAIW